MSPSLNYYSSSFLQEVRKMTNIIAQDTQFLGWDLHLRSPTHKATEQLTMTFDPHIRVMAHHLRHAFFMYSGQQSPKCVHIDLWWFSYVPVNVPKGIWQSQVMESATWRQCIPQQNSYTSDEDKTQEKCNFHTEWVPLMNSQTPPAALQIQST